MIYDADKLYIPAEFIARHDLAARNLLAHTPKEQPLGGRWPCLFPKLLLSGTPRPFTAINVNAFRVLNVASVAQGQASGFGAPERIFKSSGTSAQGRSLSAFSAAGLEAYKTSITKGFREVLATRGFSGQRGISLIPAAAAWPDSSLAAMLEWLAEVMPVDRFDGFDGFDGSRPFDFPKNAPVWVFGTAFHWVPLIDRGLLPVLPKGSLIFYTGGTKGRVRDISEAWLVAALAQGCRVPPSQIISEYGMSELASAAYTVPPLDSPSNFSPSPSQKRALGFQKNVVPFIVSGIANEGEALGALALTANQSGTGLLGVFDFNRIDLPLPIITEDVARLAPDGSFELLSRAHTAPLKGCSLLAGT